MNKITVSIVFAIILVIGINKIADVIYNNPAPNTAAYKVNVTTVSSSETQASSESSQTEDIMALFASVSAADGSVVFKKKCSSCHNIAKGKPAKIGPNIFGVLNRKAGSISDYKYSKAMVAFGKSWSVEEMDGFLTKPRDWVKNTKMSFIGLKNIKDRASVILFMNENTDNPLPLN